MPFARCAHSGFKPFSLCLDRKMDYEDTTLEDTNWNYYPEERLGRGDPWNTGGDPTRDDVEPETPAAEIIRLSRRVKEMKRRRRLEERRRKVILEWLATQGRCM